MPNPGPRARALHRAIAGRIPAATIQARLDLRVDLGPSPNATPAELELWAGVEERYSAHGPKEGGDDGHAYQLAKAGIYTGRLRKILLATGERRHESLGGAATPDGVIRKLEAGGTPFDPMMRRLVDGFAANPDPETQQDYVPEIRVGVHLDDESARPLNDAERFGELHAEQSEAPTLAVERALLPLADLAHGEVVDDLDLEDTARARARIDLAPNTDASEKLLDDLEAFPFPDFYRALAVFLQQDPQTLIGSASDRDLVRRVKAAIAFYETPAGEPVSWPQIYTLVTSLLAAAPLLSGMWPLLDTRMVPEPIRQIPWPDLSSTSPDRSGELPAGT